jgi:hypothetical protein
MPFHCGLTTTAELVHQDTGMHQRLSYILIVLELVALGVFFISTHRADSLMPEYGGNGDAVAIFLWNDRAGLALWSLVSLWLVAVARVVFLAFRRGGRNGESFAERVGVFELHAVALPVLGFIVGHILLAAFG